MVEQRTSKARFITLEGGEGAGKSTQARRLAEGLRGIGLDTLLTREPGGSPGAEEIRALLVQGAAGRWDPLTETLLHFAARRDHLTKTIRPALAAGCWVVCDRFADSTRAYQGFGLGLDRRVIETLYEMVVGTDTPDLPLRRGCAAPRAAAMPRPATKTWTGRSMNGYAKASWRSRARSPIAASSSTRAAAPAQCSAPSAGRCASASGSA